jgi:D-amino peptidase
MKRIYMMTDLEGVAGVVSFEQQAYPDGKYYEAAKRLLTAEINAAIEGLLAVGVDDILVRDGHGAGGVVYEMLHPAARLLHGSPMAPSSIVDPIVAEYEAAVLIGQHAMAGVARGNQNHTQSSRTIDHYTLNGQPIGEIGQFALYCGALGVPFIFLSGDDAACSEAEALVPGITTAAVKQGLGRGSAISLSPSVAHRRIREGIEVAVDRQRSAPLPPLVWDGPFVLEKRFFHTHTADAAMRHPGVERVDDLTVRLRSDDLLEIIYR